MRIKTLVIAIAALFSFFLPLVTKAAGAAPQAYAQSWLVHSNSFLMLAFHLKEADVKPFLPAGLKPELNEKGMVNATFEMYKTEKISGLPGYKVAFIVVDVAGHPSRTGTAGHFAIWGQVDSQAALNFFKQEIGFPYQLAQKLDVSVNQSEYVGAVSNNRGELVKIVVQPLSDKPFVGDGIVNMLAVRPGQGLVKAEVPYLTKGNFGKVSALAIDAQGDPVLTLLKGVQPQWALVSNDQVFAYSHAITIE